MITNSALIARIAIHAPARNFVTTTMISTVPVQMKPTVLITRERIIPRRTAESVSVRNSRVQCRTMPIWLSVNDTNTPTMYSWISAVTSGMQLARQVTVLGQNGSQHREAVERRVGRQHQDQRRDTGDQQKADREIVEHGVGQLSDQRFLVVTGRRADQLLRAVGDLHPCLLGQHDDANE